jgi:DNA-binding NtrC family response regulator
MPETITALLVHDGESCFQALELILREQGIKTRLARSCAEVSASLVQQGFPQLVFTSTGLCDGTWADVLNLASELKIHKSAEVIVVSDVLDQQLYLDAMENGAFDFIVRPFQPDDVAFVVRSAIWNARQKASRLAQEHRSRQPRPGGTTGGPQDA